MQSYGCGKICRGSEVVSKDLYFYCSEKDLRTYWIQPILHNVAVSGHSLELTGKLLTMGVCFRTVV